MKTANTGAQGGESGGRCCVALSNSLNFPVLEIFHKKVFGSFSKEPF